MCVAKSELEMLLEHPNICSSPLPIIFFANKMDVPGALSPVECSQQLELERISERPWHITPSNAITGTGVNEGLKWLASHITIKKYK